MPCQHPGQQQAVEPGQRRQVNLDHLQLPPDADPGDRTRRLRKAGVVHQHVHVGLPVRQRLRDLVRTAGQARVSGHDLRRDPVVRRELAAQLPQLVLAAGDEHQVRAIARELAGQFPPDPGRGAGNQHSLAPVLPQQILSGSRRCRAPGTGHSAPPLPSPGPRYPPMRARARYEIPARGSSITRPGGQPGRGRNGRPEPRHDRGLITQHGDERPVSLSTLMCRVILLLAGDMRDQRLDAHQRQPPFRAQPLHLQPPRPGRLARHPTDVKPFARACPTARSSA